MDEIVLINNPKLKDLNKENERNYDEEYRGSMFRGVSRNGKNRWQILYMIDGKKVYLTTVENILLAAIIYDILAI
jgi:hypothetical protein